MILHLDMDAFYASVEQRDHPDLRGKCVIVGGDSERGVVTTASYEARIFGVRSAMPMFMARSRCPHAVIVPPRMGRYKEISAQIMAILREIAPLVEQVSIDEAYLDLTGLDRLSGSPESIASRIKEEIRGTTRLTCSIGVAPIKFLAKIASDMKKPDGLTLIPRESMMECIRTLPVEKVPGVGKVASERLARLGIRRLGDICHYPEKPLISAMGKFGYRLKELSLGIDRSKVNPDQPPKSVSSEETLPFDTADKQELRRILLEQSEEVGRQLRKHAFLARTVTLKIKHADFRQATRSKTLNRPTQSHEVIYKNASELLNIYPLSQPVRLVGVGASKLLPLGTPIQMQLFENFHRRDEAEWNRLDQTVDDIRRKFGDKSLQKAAALESEPARDSRKKNVSEDDSPSPESSDA